MIMSDILQNNIYDSMELNLTFWLFVEEGTRSVSQLIRMYEL